MTDETVPGDEVADRWTPQDSPRDRSDRQGEGNVPRGLGRRGREWGRTNKKRTGGQRKSLKRLDSDKEIKVNPSAFLGLGLARFG
jgi:hypothetical protein